MNNNHVCAEAVESNNNINYNNSSLATFIVVLCNTIKNMWKFLTFSSSYVRTPSNTLHKRTS